MMNQRLCSLNPLEFMVILIKNRLLPYIYLTFTCTILLCRNQMAKVAQLGLPCSEMKEVMLEPDLDTLKWICIRSSAGSCVCLGLLWGDLCIS